MVNIYIDDTFFASLNETDLLLLNLFKGKEVDSNELDMLIKQSIYTRLMNYSLRILSRRPYSTFELEQKLKYFTKSKKLDLKINSIEIDEIIKKLLDDLTQKKFLDDKFFVRAYINNKLSQGKTSKRIIGLELKKKGVDKELIDNTLEELYIKDTENKTIKRLAEKKYATIHKGTKYEKRTKTLAYLIRKGFDYDKCKNILNELSL